MGGANLLSIATARNRNAKNLQSLRRQIGLLAHTSLPKVPREKGQSPPTVGLHESGAQMTVEILSGEPAPEDDHSPRSWRLIAGVTLLVALLVLGSALVVQRAT